MEQLAELRKMATVSGGQDVIGLVKRNIACAPVWEYLGLSPGDKGELDNTHEDVSTKEDTRQTSLHT